MPRSYSAAMSDIESGSVHDFAFLVAGFVVFFLYCYAWEKIKKTEPHKGYVFLATIVTLFIIPVIWWYYLTGLALVAWIPMLIWTSFCNL